MEQKEADTAARFGQVLKHAADVQMERDAVKQRLQRDAREKLRHETLAMVRRRRHFVVVLCFAWNSMARDTCHRICCDGSPSKSLCSVYSGFAMSVCSLSTAALL